MPSSTSAQAQNHPSVVAYSMSHNATGYDEDMNPDLIDGIKDPRNDSWSSNNAKLALRAEAIVKQLRPGPHRLSPLVGQPRLDAHDEFLSQFRPDPGSVRLVRALGEKGVKPVFTVRVRRAVHLGLDDVPRLVQGPARMGQRQGAVGVLPRRVERPVPRRPGLPDRRAGEERPPLGGGTVPGGQAVASLGLSVSRGIDRLRRPADDLRPLHHRQLARLPHLGRLRQFAVGVCRPSGSCAKAWIGDART